MRQIATASSVQEIVSRSVFGVGWAAAVIDLNDSGGCSRPEAAVWDVSNE